MLASKLPLILLVLPCLTAGCRTEVEAGLDSVSSLQPPRSLPLLLPEDWDTMSLHRFEGWVEGELSTEDATQFATEDYELLADALETPGLRAVRAAVLLGRSRSARAAEILIERLERRVPVEGRAADAADVVCAGALALFGDRGIAPRLAALAIGSEPHPDFEVRVECAVGALDAGREEVVEFLSDVLLLGTPTGIERGLDFGAPPTTAWGRGRASEALARWRGIPNPYRTDAPLAEREKAAARLAR